MRIKHKYLRNKAYKIKLEHRYDGSEFTVKKFITKKPATNQPFNIAWYGYRWGYERYKDRNQERYEYYDPKVRPDVPYSIVEHSTKCKYATFLQKYRNRQFRRNKNYPVSSRRCDYRKAYEYWWDLF